MIFQTEKQLKEFEEKLPDEVKKPVEEGIEDLKKAKEADDIDRMKEVMQQIEEHLMKFGEEIYRQSGGAGAPGADAAGAAGAGPEGAGPDPADPGQKEEKVVDAEVVDDEESK